jgi:phosphotransferase system HPr (HPr) family protein
MTTRTTDGLAPWDGIPPSTSSPQSSSPAESITSERFRRIVRIQNPLGLHFRAADRFARAAKRFPCSVTIFNGDLKADGKDLLSLIALCVFPDADVILEVDGADAVKALDVLAEVLGASNGEDYAI